MLKQVYAQAGKPGVSRGQFAALWREHAGHAMTLTDYFGHVSCYVQADVLAGPTRRVGGDASYFGVGELHFPSPSAREANVHAPSRAATIIPHGQAMFGHAQPIGLLCEERELFHRRQGMVKVYTFLRRADALAPEEFRRQWAQTGQALRAALLDEPTACALVQSHPLEGGPAFDGLDELIFDDTATAIRFIDTAYRDAIAPLAQPTLLVTEQIVMYKQSNYA